MLKSFTILIFKDDYMTINWNNSLPRICSYCNESYKKGEIENTDKVVQLACRDFFHKQCIASKFNQDEENKQDLTCPSCNVISIPQRISVDFNNISLEDIQAHLSAISQDPYYHLQPDVLNAVDELNKRLDSVKNLLGTILSHIALLSQENISEKEKEEHNKAIETAFKDWISKNIPPHYQCLSGKIIGDFLAGDKALRTLQKEVEYLASLKPLSLSRMIPEEGVPVLDRSNNETFKMRVSKDYMIKKVREYQFKEATNFFIGFLIAAIVIFLVSNSHS